MTREEALTFILSHRKQAEKDFLNHARELFHKNDGILPPEIREKFLNAGDQYGTFKINHDWINEMEQEIWDGTLYMGLELLRKELLE